MTTGKKLLEEIKDGLIETVCGEFIYAMTEYFVPQSDYSREWLREKFDWLKDGTNFPEAREYLRGECNYIARNYDDEEVLEAIGLNIDPRDEFLSDENNRNNFEDWCIENEYDETDYEEAKRYYFEHGKVSRDFAYELLYDKLSEYLFYENLHELRNAVVNKARKLMPYSLNGKVYTLETYHKYGEFSIELHQVNKRSDCIQVGVGPLKDYEIEEEIITFIKNHFVGKDWTPATKLRYMANTEYKNNFIENVGERLTEKYITDFIYSKFSDGLMTAIIDSAKEYFSEKIEEIWKVVLDETEDDIDNRVENIELTDNEKGTLEYLREICNSQKLEVENCYERELWKRREESLEMILDRVLDTEPATV